MKNEVAKMKELLDANGIVSPRLTKTRKEKRIEAREQATVDMKEEFESLIEY